MNEFLEFLKTFVGKGQALTAQEAENIAKQMHGSPVTQALYQHVFDLGHGQATRDFRTKETEFNTKIQALETEKTGLQTKLTELEGKTPEVAKIRQEMQGEIDNLNTQIKDLKKTHKDQRVNWYRERKQSELKDHLIGLGVDPDWAAVLVEKSEVASRLKVTETEDGKGDVTVLKNGSDSIALQGDNPLKMLAEELKKDVKPQFLTSKADGDGSESRRGGEGGGSKTVFERAREAGRTAHSTTRPEGVKSGADRLGASGGAAR
jgi:hypothetical protein